MTDASSAAPVLVVSHEATRTGAVLQLLAVLEQWTAEGHRVEVVVRRRGPMLESFAELAPTTCLTPSWGGSVRLQFDRVARGGIFDSAMLALGRGHAAGSAPYRALFLNTATNGDIVRRLPAVPTTTWVHEQARLMQRLTSPAAVRRLVAPGRRLVAVSESVRADAARLTGTSEKQIEIVRPSPVARPAADPAAARRELRRSLGLTDDTLIVGACGRLSWVKAPESFIEVAARVNAMSGDRPVAFVWLGDHPTHGTREEYQAQAMAQGVGNVHFIGEWADPSDFFAALDLFVVVSVTDAFPIVALEAAQAGAPSVCFGDTGGIGEFIRDDAGVVIPVRDLDRMASEVDRLVRDSAERLRLGATASARVAAEYRAPAVAARLWNIVTGDTGSA